MTTEQKSICIDEIKTNKGLIDAANNLILSKEHELFKMRALDENADIVELPRNVLKVVDSLVKILRYLTQTGWDGVEQLENKESQLLLRLNRLNKHRKQANKTQEDRICKLESECNRLNRENTHLKSQVAVQSESALANEVVSLRDSVQQMKDSVRNERIRTESAQKSYRDIEAMLDSYVSENKRLRKFMLNHGMNVSFAPPDHERLNRKAA